MSKTPKEIRNFLQETFGDFKDFQKKFLEIKLGSLPPKAHPHPRTIAKIMALKEWPYSFRELDDFFAVCWDCENKGVFAGCRHSAKAVIGSCAKLKREAHEEEYRLIKKEQDRKNKNGGK